MVEDYSKGDIMPQDEKEMAKELFKESFQTIIFHLPAKPKEISYSQAVTNDRIVQVKMSLMEILTGKNKVSGSIKFK